MISIILFFSGLICYYIVGFAFLVIVANLNPQIKEDLHKQGIEIFLMLWPVSLFFWILEYGDAGVNFLFKKFTSR
jgi:hypothetical protein